MLNESTGTIPLSIAALPNLESVNIADNILTGTVPIKLITSTLIKLRYARVSLHIYIYTHTHTHTYTHILIYTYIYKYTFTYKCTLVHINISIFISVL